MEELGTRDVIDGSNDVFLVGHGDGAAMALEAAVRSRGLYAGVAAYAPSNLAFSEPALPRASASLSRVMIVVDMPVRATGEAWHPGMPIFARRWAAALGLEQKVSLRTWNFGDPKQPTGTLQRLDVSPPARFGPRSMKRFLRYELDQYLRSRGTERKKELPLSRVENQGYIHYNKGSLVMYALQDYIGEENVNQAARAFLDSAAFEGPPYPTSLELIGFIREQTPPELAYLLDDMFEHITLFDNRARTATYRKLRDGRYQLKLAVSARKLRADADGVERDTPLADQIEVGVVDENGVGVALEKRWIRDTDTELTLTLDAAPARAGIDPLNKLVDRNPDDNVIAAVEQTGAAEEAAPN